MSVLANLEYLSILFCVVFWAAAPGLVAVLPMWDSALCVCCYHVSGHWLIIIIIIIIPADGDVLQKSIRSLLFTTRKCTRRLSGIRRLCAVTRRTVIPQAACTGASANRDQPYSRLFRQTIEYFSTTKVRSTVFTARRYASAGTSCGAVSVCLSDTDRQPSASDIVTNVVIFTPPPIEERSIEMTVSVCLSR